MLLTFLLAAVLWSCNCWWNAANIYTFAVQPGYLDFDNLPDTNFSCDGKVIGGYYADVETGCQMFHVCTIGQKAEITDIKFLCLNGTVFDQETRVCERLDEVDCSKSESFFDLNLELYGNNGAGYGIAPEEPPEQEPVQCNADEEDCSGTPDYFDEDVTTIAGPVVLASTAATTSTTTTSTTARPTTSTTARTTSTTAASAKKPLPAIATTSTTGPTPAVSYPTNSPETIAALIALHNAFQDSLKERERQREQGPGPKGQQQVHRYQSPQQQQQQPLPKPFTVANFQPPRHFPSKAPQPPPPPYRHQQQHRQPQHPVLLSSERFGNQNFRHGFRLQNGPPTQESPPPPPSYQQQQQEQQQQQQEQQQQQQEQQQQEQYNLDGGVQYDGSYDDDGAGGIAAVSDDVDVDVDDEESRRNFAREAPEASVSVSVQVSSSSSKNSAIDHQHQQQQRPVQVAVTTVSYALSSTATATTTTSTTASTATTTTTTAPTTTTEGPVTADRDGAARPFTAKPGAQPQEQPPVDDDDADSVDLYGEEYEEWDGGDEEFFKDVPKLGRNRKRRYAVVGGRSWRA